MYGCSVGSEIISLSPASMELFHIFPSMDESSTESSGKFSGHRFGKRRVRTLEMRLQVKCFHLFISKYKKITLPPKEQEPLAWCSVHILLHLYLLLHQHFMLLLHFCLPLSDAHLHLSRHHTVPQVCKQFLFLIFLLVSLIDLSPILICGLG